MTVMTSSEAHGAYAFEQLEVSDVVRSRLGGVAPHEEDDASAGERERVDAIRAAVADARSVTFNQSRDQVAAALSALSAAATGIDALRTQTVERVERDAIDLALALAEQIVAGAIAVEPERVVDVVRGALRRITDRQTLTIVVNPDDAEVVAEHMQSLRDELGGLDDSTLLSDRRVARGGALVQTVEGTLDAQIATQLERVRALVAEELAGA